MPKTKKTESKKKDTDSKIKPKKNTSTKVSQIGRASCRERV